MGESGSVRELDSCEKIKLCVNAYNSMDKVTVSLTDENLSQIKAVQEAQDLSRSAAVREILEQYEYLQAEYEDLIARHERLKTKHKELLNRE